MSDPGVLQRLRAAHGEQGWRAAEARDGIPVVDTDVDHLHGILAALRDGCGCAMHTFVTAIDRHPKEPRFEVAHQLLSLTHGDRVRVRVHVGAADPRVPTATDLWPGASFSERECYDMFGVVFEGHPDLRRLLMPDGYGHHPLRKEFPHHGIEPDRLYREWERSRAEGSSAR